MRRFVQCGSDGVIATAIVVSTDETFRPAMIPPGRLVIDVTARPDVLIGHTFKDTPPLVPDWTLDPVTALTAAKVPARLLVADAQTTFAAPVKVIP